MGSRSRNTSRIEPSPGAWCWWLWLPMWAASACLPEPPVDAVRVGVILTYTGDSASIGFNLERGVLLASHLIGDSASDLPIAFEFRDAQGEPERAAEITRELIDEGVVAVIGPGGDELVDAIAAPLHEAEILLLSPIATTAEDESAVALPWFRLSPTTTALGKSLAKAVIKQGLTRVGIVRESDIYHQRLTDAFRLEFLDPQRPENQIVMDVVDEEEAEVTRQIEIAQADQVEGFVLALNALPAANVITNIAAVTDDIPQWFFTPRVKSDVFLVNTSPDAIEGSIGVSADVFLVDSQAFVGAFQEEWDGEKPFEDTYFMYDAAALMLVSLDRVLRDHGEIQRELLAEELFDMTRSGGIQFAWNELGDAIARNELGKDLQYTGVTGPFLFYPDEGGQRSSGKTTVWTVEDGKIINIGQ